MVGHTLSMIVRRIAVFSCVLTVYFFLLAPLIVVAGASFDGGKDAFINFPPEQFSLNWYFDIPQSYFDTLWVSIVLAAVSAAISSVLGVMAGLGLVRSRLPGKVALTALFRAPLQVPLIVSGFAFLQLYYLIGSVTGFFANGTFLGLVVAHVFITLPFVIGTTVANLHRFPVSLEEAALSLGASRWSTFRRVTLPVIMPGVYAGGLYAFIISFGDVPVSMFLGSSKYTTFPVEVFYGLEFDFDPAILTISTIVMIGAFVLVWFFQKLIGLNNILGSGAQAKRQ